jgi:RNA recognition motif-containing protein
MAKKLYVGNLPYETTDERLKEVFSEAGAVESANVIKDKFSGRSRGFGFVEMTNDEDASKAMGMFNEKEIDGRRLIVNEAKPMTPRDDNGGDRRY